MVLHVAGTNLVRGITRVGGLAAFEGGDDRAVRLAQDVGEDVEATAVGHAHQHFAGPGRRRVVDHLVQHRDQDVVAFNGKSLLAEIGLVKETLEDLDLGKPLEQLRLVSLSRPTWKPPDSTALVSQARSAATWM